MSNAIRILREGVYPLPSNLVYFKDRFLSSNNGLCLRIPRNKVYNLFSLYIEEDNEAIYLPFMPVEIHGATIVGTSEKEINPFEESNFVFLYDKNKKYTLFVEQIIKTMEERNLITFDNATMFYDNYLLIEGLKFNKDLNPKLVEDIISEVIFLVNNLLKDMQND